MNRKRMTFLIPTVLLVVAIVLPGSALAQAASFGETFSQPPVLLEQSGWQPPTYAGGQAIFTGPFDAYRTYLRTVSGYGTTNFVAEVTVTVSSGYGGTGMAFFGLGAGEPDWGFWCEPMIAPDIYARIGPNDFLPFVGVTNGTVEHVGGDPLLGGDGTHRLRIFWDHSTGEFTFAIHRNYTGGPFVPTLIIGPVVASDQFDGAYARIFFGGAGNVTFEDFRVLLMAGVPGEENCHGTSVAGLAHEFGGLAQAARALGFASLPELHAMLDDFCSN